MTRFQELVEDVNGRRHRGTLLIFVAIVLAHWAEHVLQAMQIWAFGWPRPEALGALGLLSPWLVSSEWLHYGYAIVMLLGLWMLRSGFVGRSKTWWMIAFWIQFWHHIEHLILTLQAQVGANLFGSPVPISIVQLVIPRPELHLVYNTIVTIPMAVAMIYHLRPSARELEMMSCSCANVAKVPA